MYKVGSSGGSGLLKQKGRIRRSGGHFPSVVRAENWVWESPEAEQLCLSDGHRLPLNFMNLARVAVRFSDTAAVARFAA